MVNVLVNCHSWQTQQQQVHISYYRYCTITELDWCRQCYGQSKWRSHSCTLTLFKLDGGKQNAMKAQSYNTRVKKTFKSLLHSYHNTNPTAMWILQNYCTA